VPPIEALRPGLLPDGEVLLLIGAGPTPSVEAYRYQAQQPRPLPSMVIRPHADYLARLQGLFEVERLADRCVAVIGLGSGGSLVATQLARCGVGAMRLVDFDRLETHNIARHVCGLRDIGRHKTRAVRDLLIDSSPIIRVETFEADVLAQPDVLERVVAGCDLVVAATDSDRSKLAINRVCWSYEVPAIYGAAYNRAFGGDVFYAIPPDGACYDCFHRSVSDFFDTAPKTEADLSPGYADPDRMADLVAEPGLGIDIGVIALLLARVALMTLLHDGGATLPELPANWLLFGNRAGWVFKQPLESLFVEVPKRPDCPTCNYDIYVRQRLGMSADEAAQAAKQMLSELPRGAPPHSPE
jgi:molybdopterin/thiamine biosynthesis adenylyltransferase